MLKFIIFILHFTTLVYCRLLQPLDSDTLETIYVLFEWEQEVNTNYYQIQISITSSFEEPIVDLNTNNLIYIDKHHLNWNTNYFWRIKSITQNDAWLDTFSFFINSKLFDNIEIELLDENYNNNDLVIFSTWQNPSRRTGVFDNYGNEVWNDRQNPFIMNNVLNNAFILGAQALYPNFGPVVYNFNKNLIWESKDNYINPHDLIQLPNGNYMGFNPTYQWGDIPIGWESLFPNFDGFYWEGVKIVELDKYSKEEVWNWNSFDYYNINDYDSLGGSLLWAVNNLQYDWLHTNSIYFDEFDSSIYLSHRHISRITKISYPSGEIIWMMGPPKNTGSLNIPSGNDENICTDLLFSFQHAVRILDNGNILFYDNSHLSKIFFNYNDITSRVLEIKVIDNSFCDIIWEYNMPTELSSNSYGSVQKLENGNYFISASKSIDQQQNSILEVSENKDIVFSANLGSMHNYRAFRIPSLHPEAFEVTFENYQLIDSLEKGIILTEDKLIDLKIINHSNYEQIYSYQFTNEQFDNEDLWFENITDTIAILPNDSIDITFEANDYACYKTKINFNIKPLYLDYAEKKMNFNVMNYNDTCKVLIHPGDTDNNGIVNSEDILPIAIYYGIEGQSRESVNMYWEGVENTSWDIIPSTYADVNGDGIVNGKDIIGIGVNWGNTHDVISRSYSIDIKDETLLHQYNDNFYSIYQSLNGNDEATIQIRSLLENILNISNPQSFILNQNYPNPFNGGTQISFLLPTDDNITLSIYNVLGEEVLVLLDNQFYNSGHYSINLNLNTYQSGIYFYTLSSNNFSSTYKMVMIK